MKRYDWGLTKRFWIVSKLFWGIFWSYYLIHLKSRWYSRSWVEARLDEFFVEKAHHFSVTALQLGGLLIKLGQFISTRVDILPQRAIHELAKLQDEVQPEAFSNIKKVIEEEFKRPLGEIFSYFEENPVAAASLGQVYRGKISDGEILAIKVMRPGIENLVRIDLLALRRFIDLIKLLSNWDEVVQFDAIYQEFEEVVWQELDYLREAKNAETIAKNNTRDLGLVTPKIYWEYSRKRVLTMEYLEGIKISDFKALDLAELNRKEISRRLVNIYIKQILVDGFYHADPHPGNLFVDQNANIMMVDFGMVGEVSKLLRERLMEMAYAGIRRDHVRVVIYLKDLGFLSPEADNDIVAHAIGLLIEGFFSGDEINNGGDLNRILEELEKLLYEQPFQVPANYTYLGKAAGTLYGLCLGLDPHFNFIEEAKPYIDEIIKSRTGLGKFISEKAGALASSFIELPPLAEKTLNRVERGDLVIKIPFHDLQESIESNTKGLEFIGWSFVFGFILITAVYAKAHNIYDLSQYLFILSIIMFIFLFYKARKKKKRKNNHPPVVIKRKLSNDIDTL